MPELPEVETMVRGIRDAVEGHSITDFRRCPCACKPIATQPEMDEIRELVVDRTITKVWRRAKRVVLELEDGSAFVIEPRMTGLMLLSDPPDIEHLRFQWELQRGTKSHSVWFWDRRGLGTLKYFDKEQLAYVLGETFLGPDALDMTLPLWKQQLAKTTREIKIALLDQKLVAGIGNLYASEILHRAKISPKTPANRISTTRIKRLAECTDAILRTAIKYEGSTLGDGTYRNALNQDGSYQNEHRVYAREKLTCPDCETGVIKRIVQAQRSTFYCPRCQSR